MNDKYINIYECPVPEKQTKMFLEEILEENNIPFETKIESYWLGKRLPEYKEKLVIYIPVEFKQQVQGYIDEINNLQNIITEGIEELDVKEQYDDTEKEAKKVAKKQKMMILIYVGILLVMVASILIVGMLN